MPRKYVVFYPDLSRRPFCLGECAAPRVLSPCGPDRRFWLRCCRSPAIYAQAGGLPSSEWRILRPAREKPWGRS